MSFRRPQGGEIPYMASVQQCGGFRMSGDMSSFDMTCFISNLACSNSHQAFSVTDFNAFTPDFDQPFALEII